MSSWTSPITWSSGSVVTASQMNTEIRDHLNFLKGALDVLTNSTTADTGTGMSIVLTLAGSANTAFNSRVSGDTDPRFNMTAAGGMGWGDGTGGADTNLYRSAADTLACDDQFVLTRDAAGANSLTLTGTTAGNGLTVGTDTNLFRAAANFWRTDDQFHAVDGITTRVVAGVVSDGSFTITPGSGTIAIDTTNSRIYVRVGATWKMVAVA